MSKDHLFISGVAQLVTGGLIPDTPNHLIQNGKYTAALRAIEYYLYDYYWFFSPFESDKVIFSFYYDINPENEDEAIREYWERVPQVRSSLATRQFWSTIIVSFILLFSP